jgi:cytochrome o ubiquinol oxidase subunit 3
MIAMQRKQAAPAGLAGRSPACWALGFLSIELFEFSAPDPRGRGPAAQRLPLRFFTLVGTHGLHVSFGIVWLVTLMVQVGKHGLTRRTSAA